MRLDKFLKVSRLIKRRRVANEACDAGRVLVLSLIHIWGFNLHKNNISKIEKI